MIGKFGRGRMPGELYKNWPKDENGEPVAPKFLVHRLSVDMADVVLVSMLESYGIPAMILHPGDGDFGKVVLGMSGTGSSIFVPETLYEDAKGLMEAQCDDELQG